MIRAHLATFPARAGILMQTVQSILPQVDRLCICLNQYEDVPTPLAQERKIETLIPDRDLKDAGKFAFEAAADDFVFTIDDDILYPPDYVKTTLQYFDRLDPQKHVLGHMGHALLKDAATGVIGWKNWMFGRKTRFLFKVDILGTGTTCQLGAHLPRLDQVETAAGFVDLRHAYLQAKAGRWLWVPPHEAGWMTSTMTEDLHATSLFTTFNRASPPALRAEIAAVVSARTPYSGQRFRPLRQAGLLP